MQTIPFAPSAGPDALRLAGQAIAAVIDRLSPLAWSSLAIAMLFVVLMLAWASADLEAHSLPASRAEMSTVASQQSLPSRKP